MISLRPWHCLDKWLALFLVFNCLFLNTQQILSFGGMTSMHGSQGLVETIESEVMLLQTKLNVHRPQSGVDLRSQESTGRLLQWMSGLVTSAELDQPAWIPDNPFITGTLDTVDYGGQHPAPHLRPLRTYPTFASWASQVGFLDKHGHFTLLAIWIIGICCIASMVMSFAMGVLLISCCKSTQIDRAQQFRTLAIPRSPPRPEPDENLNIITSAASPRLHIQQ
eukprot:gnl/MRDRNA2_/MRDRNA2_111627_c0_seq1.p1 gnl/MRDRNA2_/MRDRNA2_111627_c0~~gnl/MRDRNA2_/MRDRNA2_111627_c0_seq1.p1  ORF type:complete len:223 (-),score=20.20 gnl/MRDRNA2_/MRDRNA2_111627_c0_seq1:70-738(-)